MTFGKICILFGIDLTSSNADMAEIISHIRPPGGQSLKSDQMSLISFICAGVEKMKIGPTTVFVLHRGSRAVAALMTQ